MSSTTKPAVYAAERLGEVSADPDSCTSDEPLVLTVDEAAALLRVDRKTLYTAIQRGKVPGVRQLGRTIRIARAEFLQWLGADGPRPPAR